MSAPLLQSGLLLILSARLFLCCLTHTQSDARRRHRDQLSFPFRSAMYAPPPRCIRTPSSFQNVHTPPHVKLYAAHCAIGRHRNIVRRGHRCVVSWVSVSPFDRHRPDVVYLRGARFFSSCHAALFLSVVVAWVGCQSLPLVDSGL